MRNKWHVAMVMKEQGFKTEEIAEALNFKSLEVEEYFRKVFGGE